MHLQRKLIRRSIKIKIRLIRISWSEKSQGYWHRNSSDKSSSTLIRAIPLPPPAAPWVGAPTSAGTLPTKHRIINRFNNKKAAMVKDCTKRWLNSEGVNTIVCFLRACDVWVSDVTRIMDESGSAVCVRTSIFDLVGIWMLLSFHYAFSPISR